VFEFGEIMNNKLLTLAIIIILDIILLASAEKMPTVDYLSVSNWESFETAYGSLHINFKTDKTFIGKYTPQGESGSKLFKGTYKINNREVSFDIEAGVLDEIFLDKAVFKFLEDNPEYDYGLVFNNMILFNTDAIAQKGKKLKIDGARSVILNREKVTLTSTAICKTAPTEESKPYMFESWSIVNDTIISLSQLRNGQTIELLARSQHQGLLDIHKDFWYYVSFASVNDQSRNEKCWVHGSQLALR
jgi:hypothetical protein